jgi:hypothetical protein
MRKENNTIVLVRALVKLSSALYDIDNMRVSPKHKFNMRIDVDNFHVWLEEYMKEPMKSLGNADGSLLVALIQIFDNYEETVFVRNEYFTSVNLFLAKAHSALADLKELDSIHSTYVIELIDKLNILLSKGYFKQYTSYTSEEGNTFHDLVKFMNDKGKTIIVGTL